MFGRGKLISGEVENGVRRAEGGHVRRWVLFAGGENGDILEGSWMRMWDINA
jgi:hypothetical protein